MAAIRDPVSVSRFQPFHLILTSGLRYLNDLGVSRKPRPIPAHFRVGLLRAPLRSGLRGGACAAPETPPSGRALHIPHAGCNDRRSSSKPHRFCKPIRFNNTLLRFNDLLSLQGLSFKYNSFPAGLHEVADVLVIGAFRIFKHVFPVEFPEKAKGLFF